MEGGEVCGDKMSSSAWQETARWKDWRRIVSSRSLCDSHHVCPVCLKEWKLCLFWTSCRPGGGAQQRSAASVDENISFSWNGGTAPPRERVIRGLASVLCKHSEGWSMFGFGMWKSSQSLSSCSVVRFRPRPLEIWRVWRSNVNSNSSIQWHFYVFAIYSGTFKIFSKYAVYVRAMWKRKITSVKSAYKISYLQNQHI